MFIKFMKSKRFLQTRFWALFKSRHGWTPLFLKPSSDFSSVELSKEECEEEISVLIRRFSLLGKSFSLAYVPLAPEFTEEHDEKGALDYLKKIKALTEKSSSFFPKDTMMVRYDFPMDFSTTEERDLFIKNAEELSRKNFLGIKKSHVDIQPPDTAIINLLSSEEEILAEMKNKWRYNIRLASKKGVEIEKWTSDMEGFEKAFDIFYDLFMETSKRDGVNFHSKDYYKDLLEESSKMKEEAEVRLYLARHENDYLAGIITLFCPREAVYLYGASGNIKRNFMSAYLLQWTAMKDAKEAGCPCYDLYGMPPTEDPEHPMHGLYLFKSGFGGKIIHRPGSFDIPLKKGTYRLYRRAEKIRAWFYKKLVKKIKRR